MSTDVLMYAPHFQGVLPAPQTVWPTGYPFLIGLLSKTGISTTTAALAINFVFHAIAALVLWLILLRLEISRFFATLCTFGFYIMAIPWMYVISGITEPVFTTLLLGACLLLPLPKSVDQSNSNAESPALSIRSLLPWIICGLVMTFSIYIRYSSVFMAAGVGAGLFCYALFTLRLSSKELVRYCLKLSVMMSLPFLAFCHLMLRTHALVGTLDRYSGEKEPETWASTIVRWAAKSSELLGFNGGELISGRVATVLFLIFLGLAALIPLFFLTARSKKDQPAFKTSLPYAKLLCMVVGLHTLGLVIYVSISSVNTTPLEIITRYVYQIYPGIYAVFCYALYWTVQHYKEKRTGTAKLVHGSIAALVAIYLFAQINSLIAHRGVYFYEALSHTEMVALPVNDELNLANFIDHCYSENENYQAIWSTHGQQLHQLTGYATVTHNTAYTKVPFKASKLEQQIDAYNIGLFLFINSDGKYGDSYNNYMNDVRDWLQKNGYVKLPMLDSNFGIEQSVDVYYPASVCSV